MWITVEFVLIIYIGIIKKFIRARAGELAMADSYYQHFFNPQETNM